jgi:hypothetical protein
MSESGSAYEKMWVLCSAGTSNNRYLASGYKERASMLSFRDWGQKNFKQPKTNQDIVDAVAEYLDEIVEEAHHWARGPGNNLKTEAQQRLAIAFNAKPAPNPAQPQAIPTWAQTTLKPAIDNVISYFTQQQRQALTMAVTQKANGHVLATATTAIPDPYTYFGDNYLAEIERAQVIGYIDYVSAAIRAYVTQAVPHSNEMKRQADTVTNQLAACKQDTFLGSDSTVCQFGIFNKNIPNAVGAKSIKDIAERWSKERLATAGRLQSVQVWNNLQGAEPPGASLRRYGSTGEGDDIRAQRGFYQKLGVSFERYKWFVDLSVQGATTSVADTDRSFWAYLKGGAVDALNQLKQVYTLESVPAVTYKPDMGGETGCFGVHEDVLAAFNTKLIKKIVIRNQQTKKDITPDVVP